jgi:peptide subunit release factor 1 (eRF1)
VQHALKRGIERLKLEKEAPPNGAVLLSGYFESPLEHSALDDSKDCVLYFEPPLPVKHFVYFCDKRFHLDAIAPLYEHSDVSKKFAVCIVRGTDSVVFQYLPDVDLFKALGSVQGTVRNNHSRGGQSQNRYQRLREGDVHEMVKKIAGLCERTCFNEDKLPLVQTLLLVGPGERKRQVAEQLQSTLTIPDNFTCLVTSDGTEAKSLEDAKERITNELCPQEYRAIEKEVQGMIDTRADLLVFGMKESCEALSMHALQKLYVLKDSISPELQKLLDSGTCADVFCLNVSPLLERLGGGVVGVRWY